MSRETVLFTPVWDFFSEAFDSHYCRGLRYAAHPENTRLRDAVEQWVKEGKVTVLPLGIGAPPAWMGGSGSVGGN